MADDDDEIAVVGAGISGLSAAYLLARAGKRVTLFEADNRCGGHALTLKTPYGEVDVGFQVCNLTTYPHLMGFLDALGVDTEESDMSFALSTPDVEWGSRGLGAVFATPGSARSPRFIRMLAEVVRFGRGAEEVLRGEAWADASLGDYLRRRGYSHFFAAHYVVPMCAAIWSCSHREALAFPVVPLVRFWRNHHLLALVNRPTWRVLKGRSRAYVDACVRELRAMGSEVRTCSKVVSVTRDAPAGGSGVALRVEGEEKERRFSRVVLATHADVSRRLLGPSAAPAEADALGAIRYVANTVYVHADASLMPRARAAWASWNCVRPGGADASDDAPVCVSYWINLLQNLPEGTPDLFATLNPPTPPDEVLAKVVLDHGVHATSPTGVRRAQGLGLG